MTTIQLPEAKKAKIIKKPVQQLNGWALEQNDGTISTTRGTVGWKTLGFIKNAESYHTSHWDPVRVIAYIGSNTSDTAYQSINPQNVSKFRVRRPVSTPTEGPQ